VKNGKAHGYYGGSADDTPNQHYQGSPQHGRKQSKPKVLQPAKSRIRVTKPEGRLSTAEVDVLSKTLSSHVQPTSLTPHVWIVGLAACLPNAHPLRQFAIQPELLQRFSSTSERQRAGILFEVLSGLAAASTQHPLADSLYWRHATDILDALQQMQIPADKCAPLFSYLLSQDGYNGCYTAQLILKAVAALYSSVGGLNIGTSSLLFGCLSSLNSPLIRKHLDSALGAKLEQRYITLLTTLHRVMARYKPLSGYDQISAAFLKKLSETVGSSKEVHQLCSPPKPWPLSRSLF
jgi:hypothetical protein